MMSSQQDFKNLRKQSPQIFDKIMWSKLHQNRPNSIQIKGCDRQIDTQTDPPQKKFWPSNTNLYLHVTVTTHIFFLGHIFPENDSKSERDRRDIRRRELLYRFLRRKIKENQKHSSLRPQECLIWKMQNGRHEITKFKLSNPGKELLANNCQIIWKV